MGAGAGAAGQGRVSLPSGGSISVERHVDDVLLVVHDRPDLAVQFVLGVDNSIAHGSAVSVRVIAEVTKNMVILEDTYYSRPGALSYCQAGWEQFLRVLELATPAKETMRVKLASCLGNLELDESGVVWDAGGGTLTVHWIGREAAVYKIEVVEL